MTHRLTPSTLLMLTLPPLLWAGNAVVGKSLAHAISPVLLNTLRWGLALVVLLPWAHALWRDRALVARHAGWFFVTGFLGMGLYNAVLYQALHTSSPLNVTLISSSLPVFMLVVGAVGFQARPRLRNVWGAGLTLMGVVVVVSQGAPWKLADSQLVRGDLLMLGANLAWAIYSWLLTRAPEEVQRWGWAERLSTQVIMGLLVASLGAGAEHWSGHSHFEMNLDALAGWIYLAVGPSVVAYRCWSLGVERAGPTTAAIFYNLTPLFTGLLSVIFMAESPHPYHLYAFMLIAVGIWVSSNR